MTTALRTPSPFIRMLIAGFVLVFIAGPALAQAWVDEPVAKPGTWGADAQDWTRDVPDWKPVKAGDHPRLVFRKDDLAALRKRADTPGGKVILARMQKLLDDKFTLWHPASYGLLYQLTGEQQYADKAKALVEEILDHKVRDKDNRYGFTNPGSGGPMRAGPAIGAVGLAYDLNYDGWDSAFRTRVAKAILDNPYTASIAAKGPLGPSVNHYGAAVGGVGIGLLAIRHDDGVDQKKVEELLEKIVRQARMEIARGYGDRGYYFEGHQCGRISSNSGLIPFVLAYRVGAGKDLVTGKDNARWLAAKWIYEFALDPDGKYTNAQRGMYCRNLPRGGMVSQNGDFAQGFAICPPELLPAFKWVYNHQVEPGDKKTYDVIDYPHHAIYSLAHWPFDVEEKNPQEQPELFPRVLHDTGSGHVIFRNGWSAKGDDIVVTALLGTHQNGRGMASGGSVYVIGKGLGWKEPHARYRFPGIFYTSYPVYSKFEKDGSGVISAVTYTDKVNKFTLDRSVTIKQPTSLAVDYSGKSGADALVAMAGPMVGYQVEYWMDIKPAKINDITGQDGYATHTTKVTLGGQPAYVMTLQKGDAPAVRQEGDTVFVGDRKLSFDGVKIVLE